MFGKSSADALSTDPGSQRRTPKEASIYFNNDPTGAAIRDARAMIQLLE